MKKTVSSLLAASMMSICALNANATELIEGHLRVSGFGTFAVSQSDNATPYYVNRNITDEVCWDCDTTLGLQFDATLTDSLFASLQLVKRPRDDFSDPEVEWAYIGWQATDSLQLRAGRLRIPLQLASDYYYVGQSYTWLRLPSEVYNASAGVNYYTGVGVEYLFEVGDSWTASLYPFWGFHQDNKLDRIQEEWEIDIEFLRGVSLRMENESLVGQITYLESKLQNKSIYKSGGVYDLLTAQGQPAEVTMDFEFRSIGIGLNYHTGPWDLWSEYSWSKTETTFGGGIGRVGYVGGSYNFDKFSPYAVYSKHFGEGSSSSDTATIGLRWDVLPNVSVTVDYSHMTMNGAFDPASIMQPDGQFVYSPYDFNVVFNPMGPPTFDWFKYGEDDVNVTSMGINFTF